MKKIVERIIHDNDFLILDDEGLDGHPLKMKMGYEHATCFSVLDPKLRKQAKLVRKAVFDIKALFKISQQEIHGELTFWFYKDKISKNIEFSKPAIDPNERPAWSIDKKSINPEISLTPWHYQKSNIALRANLKSGISLSQKISFRESRDFGIDVLENYLAKTKRTSLTFKDLIEISENSKEMDFSDYIEEQRLKHFRSCINDIENYYYCKNSTNKLYMLLEEQHYSYYLPRNIEELIPHKLLNNKEKLLKAIETHFPFFEKPFLLSDLKNYKKEYGVQSKPDDKISPSIDSNYNLLSGATSSAYNNSLGLRAGDIIVSTVNYSFGKIAIVDKSNTGRFLTDEATILGNCTDEVYIWNLLRTDYIQKQISAYNDINLKKICYRSVFDNIYIDPKVAIHTNINKLSFQLACLLVSKTFVCNKIGYFILGNEFDELIKDCLSSSSTEYFILTQKTQALIRSAEPGNVRKCLIIHNKETEQLVKNIKSTSTKNCHCNITDITTRRDVFSKAVKSDICLICLPFDSIEEILLIKKIIQIMGVNHIIIQQDKKNTVVGEVSAPSKLTSCLGPVNYCTLTGKSKGLEIIQNILTIAYRPDYLEKIFKDLLLCMSDLPSDCFKKVYCQGVSKARKGLTSKDIKVFTDIQKQLIHLAYTFSTSSLLLLDINLWLAQELDAKLAPTVYLNVDLEWKEFKNKYHYLIKNKTLNGFIKAHQSLILDCKEDLQNLHKICNKGIEYFKEELSKIGKEQQNMLNKILLSDNNT